MKFSEEQIAKLNAKLDSSHVATRAQGGKQLSYIEGWHAIAEANRIFGFDAWTRETVSLLETSRDLCRIKGYQGKPDYDQWRVSYLARVRITVGEIVREGTGYGSGMSKPEDLGGAIESAAKEAETDAMKRALMTFGNPFGLALYDKTRANVETETIHTNAMLNETLANHERGDGSYEPPPRRASGLPEYGWREDGSKTSYALKKEGSWEELKAELDADLVDCHTLLQLEQMKEIYRGLAKGKNWNRQFMDALKQEFDAHEKSIMETMEAAELAEVPLKTALKQSIKYNPDDARTHPANTILAGG